MNNLFLSVQHKSEGEISLIYEMILVLIVISVIKIA